MANFCFGWFLDGISCVIFVTNQNKVRIKTYHLEPLLLIVVVYICIIWNN